MSVSGDRRLDLPGADLRGLCGALRRDYARVGRRPDDRVRGRRCRGARLRSVHLAGHAELRAGWGRGEPPSGQGPMSEAPVRARQARRARRKSPPPPRGTASATPSPQRSGDAQRLPSGEYRGASDEAAAVHRLAPTPGGRPAFRPRQSLQRRGRAPGGPPCRGAARPSPRPAGTGMWQYPDTASARPPSRRDAPRRTSGSGSCAQGHHARWPTHISHGSIEPDAVRRSDDQNRARSATLIL